ncbi:2OG-Fe(II) oxygenase superfamily protein [Colwellia chukchiensis]|uniref:2OG-Fe(II) oxygenase superfamily protein n=1 Tax=Colwellia chukchiensis TaxID=641665 RepID=A0A1H7GLN8_9GAMM|nr:2OG-Fe(II) oxygenase family protein [Colwellia chukchiensis]SEK38457.1 2OG-Fe(II) oxygenase superfamily protein [Colwellia chukchiensis]
MKLSLNEPNNISKLKQDYLAHGYVQLQHALSADSANLISEKLATQKQWNLVYRRNGCHQDLNSVEVATWSSEHKNNLLKLVHSNADNSFQYFYETIPIYDIYYDKLLPGHFFNDIVEFLNSEPTLNLFRTLLNAPEINFADAQITRFSAGHFLNRHNDDVPGKNRVAAFVINLTKEWRADWGGALQLLTNDLDIKKSFMPTFNDINIFKVPVEHLVTYVPPYTPVARLSITGWLRSGVNPKDNKGQA